MFKVDYLKDPRNDRQCNETPLPPQTRLKSSDLWNSNGQIKRSPRLVTTFEIFVT